MRVYERYGKRLFDIVSASIGILLFLPLLLVIAVSIKVTAGSPVVFKQQRIGKGGKLFHVLKFRSMRNGQSTGALSFEPGQTGRVTAVGRILRKTKLDELPQLFNVLWGELSLVGPRPEVPKYKQYYTGKYAKILQLRPGITDRASMKYSQEELLLSRSSDPERFYTEVILPDKLAINVAYMEKGLTFWEDIKIIVGTITHIVRA